MVESCVALRVPTADTEQMAMPLKDIWIVEGGEQPHIRKQRRRAPSWTC